MIREWTRQSATRRANDVTFRAPDEHFLLKNTTFPAPAIFPNFTKYCACHEKCHLTFTKYCACHEKGSWPSPSTAPVTKSDTWPSPSTAPATQNDSHAWSSSHMKRHFQCEEQQMSPSKLTKYCACHAKWPPNIYQKFDENSWNVISNARPIRAWSETVPRMNPSVRNPPRKQGYLSRSGRVFSIEKYNVSRSGYLSKFHQVLCLPRKVTLQLHQVLRLPRKVTLELHQVLRLPRKVTLELHQVLRLPRKVTLELHQVLRLPRKVTLDLHQVLRLPHRMTRRLDPRHIWNVISNARSNKCHPPNSPNTAPATQNDHATSGRNLRKTAETSFPMCAADPSMIREWSDHVPRPFASVRNPPRNRGSFSRSGRTVCIEKYNISRSGYLSKFHQVLRLPRKVTLELHQVLRLPRKMTLELHQVLRLPRKWHLNFTKYCAYHAKWHLNFTKYCAYHEKWHLTFTKYCAYHEKWHLTFTKYCACHTEWLAGLILVTYETSFPMCGETNVTLQTHQILRLPRKITMQHLAEICEKQLKRHFQCAADPSMIREWSDHVPRPFPSVRNPPRNRGYFSRSRRTVCIEKYNISRSGYLSKFHQVLRLPRKVTLKLHQVLRLPRKVTLDLHQVLRLPHRMTRRLDPRHIWNVISNVRRNKCHTPNSPNTAPATQNDHATSGRNLRKTAETSFPMRGRSEHDPRMIRSRSETVCVSPQPATQQRLLFALQTNGLYWKIQHFALRLSFQISPSTAPTTKSNTWTSPSTAPTTKSDTWPSPSTARLYLTLLLRSDCTWLYSYRLYLTLLLRSDCNWLYYYAAILLIDSILLRTDCTWLYSYAAIVLDSTITHRLYLTLLLRSDCTWLYYYAAIVLDSTTTQRLYLTLLRSDCTWLYSYAAIVLDSTTTQRLYLTLLLRSDCTWLYYYAAIVLDSTITHRLYLTLLLRSDCTWLYYYAAIVLDSTTTQRLYLTLLLRTDCTWLYSYAAIVLDSTTTQRLYLTLLLRSDCTWLYYYAAILLLCDVVRISEVSQLNFLWLSDVYLLLVMLVCINHGFHFASKLMTIHDHLSIEPCSISTWMFIEASLAGDITQLVPNCYQPSWISNCKQDNRARPNWIPSGVLMCLHGERKMRSFSSAGFWLVDGNYMMWMVKPRWKCDSG